MLVVEDEPAIAELQRRNLTQAAVRRARREQRVAGLAAARRLRPAPSSSMSGCPTSTASSCADGCARTATGRPCCS